MGRNLALNIEEHGFSVAVWNLETDWTDTFLATIRRNSRARRRSTSSCGRSSGRGAS